MEHVPSGLDRGGPGRVGRAALAVAVCGVIAGCSFILDFDDSQDNPAFDASMADAGPVGDGGDPCAAYEPNDSLAQAFVLAGGTYAPIGICPAGDHDFFQFTVDGSQDVVIEALFTNAAGMDLEMRLYDGTGMVIDRSETFDSNERIERSAVGGNLLAAGDYIIEIFGFNDTDQNTYTLNLTITAP